MNFFRATISLSGPTGGSNSWQADTIFGHLCWVLRYANGTPALEAFLDRYRQADESNGETEPPLLLSNGLPESMLPKPLHFDHTFLEASQDSGAPQSDFDRGKDVRKWQYLTTSEFDRVQQGERVSYDSGVNRKFGETRVTLKNQLNRMSNTTDAEGGELFPFEETFVQQVTIYCGVVDGEEQLARSLFELLQFSGYGKRKSVGYGTISSVDWQPTGLFQDVAGANAAMSLSNFAPALNDPTSGWWTTFVKYGKLGEEFARLRNPFKRPLVMLAAGSVLRDDSPKRFYGRMVRNIVTRTGDDPPVFDDIVHYGYALTVPLVVPAGA